MANIEFYDSNIALAQPFSVSVASVAMANSISLLMDNAVNNEAHSQAIQNASVSQCNVLILSSGAAGATKGK